MRLVRPSLLVVALLLAPFALVISASAGLAESAATQVAVALTGCVGVSRSPTSAETEASESVTELQPDLEVAAGSALAEGPVRGRAGRSPANPPTALFVSASAVLRLAQGAARPRGSFVSAGSERPAGLRLSGVSGLGLGLEDGDTLVEALGRPAHNSSEIVGAIIAARATRAAQLTGMLWRRGRTFPITVQQPY